MDNRPKNAAQGKRLAPTVLIFVVTTALLLTPQALGFQIAFVVWAILAICELISFYLSDYFHYRLWYGEDYLLLWIALLTIVLIATVYITRASQPLLILTVSCAWGSDAIAWLIGTRWQRMFHRPPHRIKFLYKISPKKTWEGTIAGIIGAALITVVAFGIFWLCGIQWQTNWWWFLISGPIAIIGDLLESSVKRCFGVKDSIEILAKNNALFRKLQSILGGHGGCLDRIDSVVAIASTLMLTIIVCN